MDSVTKELSPAPSISASSTKGFKGVVAKARLGRKDNPSVTSLNGPDDSNEGRGVRNSVDSLIDRARANRASSTDDNLPAGPSNLSKFIPGRVKKKRRQREEAEQAQQEAESDRGRAVEEQPATSATPRSPSGNDKSQEVLGDDGDDSLVSIESDEPNKNVRPDLTSHDSHIGYLTSSSPLITTSQPIGDEPNTPDLDDPAIHDPKYKKATTLPVELNKTGSTSNLAPQHAASFGPRKGQGSPSRLDRSTSRGVSPGAKIRDVFSTASRKKMDSPPKSPDRDSLKSINGKPLGSIFNKDKKRSSNLGGGSEASGSVLSIVTSPTSANSSTREFQMDTKSPQMPPSAGLEHPATLVTPPTPTMPNDEPSEETPSKAKVVIPPSTNPNVITSASGNMISHRRVRSDTTGHVPSKLSNATSAPLTPTIEERSTPGTRSPPSQGSIGGGFFSSVFSAAQNAANTFSNTISNNPPRSRSGTQTEEDAKPSLDALVGSNSEVEVGPGEEKRPLAIHTLGTGELSLSHLGIASDSPTSRVVTNGSTSNGALDKFKDSYREEIAARAENASAARAVSQAYSEKPSINETPTSIAEDVDLKARPKSFYESSIITGDRTPPTGSIYEGEAGPGIRRSGSVRSRVGAVARRHRNSSSVTGGTIGAAIGAGHAALANPAAAGSTTKLTGFAVASKKRNRDFHQSFRSVPEDDYLIEDYSCALQRDIILAGRIYIAEGHICFSSNILGWVTTLVISFDEVVSVEKENTAMVFPNAIAIQTLHARHTFRSLLSREATYELLIGIWKLSHPNLKSSLNGARLDQGGTGDKTEKIDPSSEDMSDNSDDEDEVYDEDEDEDEEIGSVTENGGGSVIVAGDTIEQPKPVTRKASALGVAAGAAAAGGPIVGDLKAGERAAAAANTASQDFPGPATHGPTECGDGDSHYDKPLKDDIIPAPLGKVFSMVFGPASGGWMARWLIDEGKVTELQLEDDKKGLSEESKTRSFSYIKPLYSSIGPKSTKCLVTDTLDSIDLDKAISVTQSTQTPDVPSGNVFLTKTHFCFMWAPGNATRLVVNFTIEWSGKSWLKGPIEKGATDGQTVYCNDLVKALKAGVASRSRAGTNGSKAKGKGKKRKGDSATADKSVSGEKDEGANTQQASSSWGPLEPVHDMLSPVIDIFSPMISSNMVIGFLLFIILINYFRAPPSPSSRSMQYGMPPPERMAAYEGIWRREESDFWEWLDRRVGMQGGGYYTERADHGPVHGRGMRHAMRSKLDHVKMSDREVDHAIKVTEEKLGLLKQAVREKRELRVKADSATGEQGDIPPE